MLVVVVLLLVVALGWWRFRSSDDRPQDRAACLDRVSEQVARWRGERRPADEILRLAETRLAGCARSLDDAGARFVGGVNADLARTAQRVVSGESDVQQYLFLVRDRIGKFHRWERDRGWRDAFSKGDDDGDLVPDAYDRCPGTPPLAITDEHGCEVHCRGAGAPCGDLAPAPADPRELLQSVRFLVNPACDGAPAPTTPEPLEWGRGTQSRSGTTGFNFSVTKVSNQPGGCEFFYEFDLQLEHPNSSVLPPVKHVRVLFKDSENLDPGNGRRAVFGVPAAGEPASVVWTPGRRALRDALHSYATVYWRVRVVNGAQRSSVWSAGRTQGPSPGGVPV
jgi:hypothetical protein